MADIRKNSIQLGTLLVKSEALWRFPDFEYEDGTIRGERAIEHWDMYESIQLEKSSEDRFHTVTEREIGRLDIIANRFYGDTHLFRFIAIANNLMRPHEEMFVGQVLRIPGVASIQKALRGARQRKAQRYRGLENSARSTVS